MRIIAEWYGSQMSVGRLLSVEEYLNTSYSPDMEFRTACSASELDPPPSGLAPPDPARRRNAGLVNRARLPVHVVHQQVLTERVRGREIGLPAADLRHLLDEVHQSVIARQHKRVDQNSLLLT